MEAQGIKILAIYQAQEGKMPQLREAFERMKQHTLQEEGNISYVGYTSQQDENMFFILEEYTNEAAIEAHRNAAYFQEIVIGQIVPLLAQRTVHRIVSTDN